MAFEHRNDANEAALAVLTDMLPKLKEQLQPLAAGSSSNSDSSLSPSEGNMFL